MQFTNFLLPMLFALGVAADDLTTSVSTYYTTATVLRVVETTTTTSTTTPIPSSTSSSVVSTSSSSSSSSSSAFTTQVLTQAFEKVAAANTAVSASQVYLASASSGALPQATNGTGVAFASSSPSATVYPYTNGASASTVQFGAAAAIAAIVGFAQVL